MKNIAVMLFSLIQVSVVQFVTAQRPDITVTLFRDSALASTWCPYDSTLVAYDLLQPDGYYNIYLANVSAGNTILNERCFTCNNSALPGKNVAQPAFQPSGKYMLFMGEDATHAGTSTYSIPGVGMYNDLYVMTMDGSKTYRLTYAPDTGVSAMIEPYFSPDGTEIMWDAMTTAVGINGKQEFGYWVVNIAPFITDDTVRGPYIDSTHMKILQPGGVNAFNEPYGWSPDGSKIIFASDYNQFWVWDDQIYTMDTDGNNIEQMSSTAHNYPYCEHAFYSADGKHIVWMTNEDCDTGSSVGGDDWWIMNSDTTDQMRLTYFNDTTSPYWTGSVHINCHGSFCPAGQKFIGDVTGSEPVQVDPAASIGAIYIVTLNYLLTGISDPVLNPVKCSLYPNPASELVNVTVSGEINNQRYAIYNVWGNKILESESSNNTFTIDVSNFANGVYFLNIYGQGAGINEKFVVERK